MTSNIQKPFLKWVGGKTQIISTLLDSFPKEINDYHEIFLGGGSVLFGLLSYIKNDKIKLNGKIYAYDVNKGLIGVYKNIQSNYNELYDKVMYYRTEYHNCPAPPKDKKLINRKPQNIQEAKNNKESYYFWLRQQFNSLTDRTTIEGSSLFIVLNKLCFRGVYREGPHGFNVPYGNYKNTPEIFTLEFLKSLSELIKDVKFKVISFEASIKNILDKEEKRKLEKKYKYKKDFIYLDPPYAPENSKSFVGYNKDGFTLEQHKKLFSLIKELSNIEKKIMMSNAKVDLVTSSFQTYLYKIKDIECRRAIHSKNPESKTTEVIITNY